MNKPKTTMDYFKHSTLLSESDEIKKLKMKTRNNFCKAYTLYMVLLERLARNINSDILEIDEDYIDSLSYDLFIDSEEIKKYLDQFQNLSILNISKCEVIYILSDSDINATKSEVLSLRKSASIRINNSRNEIRENNSNVRENNDNVLYKDKEKKRIEENRIEENNKVIVIQEESGTTTTTTTNDLISLIDSFSSNLNDNHRLTITNWINTNSQAVYDMITRIQNSGKNSVNFNYLSKTYKECLDTKNIQNLKNLSGNIANLESNSNEDTNLSEEEQAKELEKLKELRKQNKKTKFRSLKDNEEESEIVIA